MKIEKLIEQLQNAAKRKPNAEVKMHHKTGNNVLFVLSCIHDNDIVWLEDRSDCDLSEELDLKFKIASDKGMDELDFFMDLLDTGFTLDDIEKYCPEKYEYSKTFMEEHGLI